MRTTNTNHIVRLLLAGLALFIGAAVGAQDPSIQMRENFTDDELKSFVKANEKVVAIQMEGEEKMVKAIEGEGLTVNRFHEILEEQRDPQRVTDSSATVEELRSFNDAAALILEENKRLEQRMASSIEEEGIDIDTYKQIMLAYQQNADVQNRVNKMLNGEK